MKITTLRLSNFQSFGPAPTAIDLADLTYVLGPNGSGKTTVLEALSRLFSPLEAQLTGYQKVRNVERDPRVAVAVSDPASPTRYITVRGRVTATTTDGAADQIEALAQKYLGGPYPWYGGRDQTRATMVITIDKIHTMGR